MTDSKVWGIVENDFFTLIKKLNEFGRDKRVFATQIFNKPDGWYALLYYKEKDE